MKIYEIQNQGKGLITSLDVADVVLLSDSNSGIQGLQDVILINPNLDFGNIINVQQSLDFNSPTGGEMGINEVSPTVDTPFAYIGKKRGNTATDVSLFFTQTKALFRDFQNNRGVEYDGDYEVNFLPRSLVTKQYVQTQTDGSQTKVNAGTNISVTGNGTIATPYIINNTLIVDGSETKLNNGITTTVTGNGTVGIPYIVETVNLQKSITGDYTLTPSDNNYSIKADNGITPITITIPTGLPENFFVGITQKGDGDITLIGTGTTLNNPVGLKIKGKGYYVGIEHIGTSNVFDVLANTKL